MGKRSEYARKPRDYYPTPQAAVKPLIPLLPNTFSFAEPCAGDGRLIKHIKELHGNANCLWSSDIEPQHDSISCFDALNLSETEVSNCDLIITNPPWERTKASGYLLHAMIERFSSLKPTWLLFDADWIHTIQSSDLVKNRLCKIVSIGRVKWIEDSAGTGKDNCCWYLFDSNKAGPTEFYGR